LFASAVASAAEIGMYAGLFARPAAIPFALSALPFADTSPSVLPFIALITDIVAWLQKEPPPAVGWNAGFDMAAS
jgi:hypothetical protein